LDKSLIKLYWTCLVKNNFYSNINTPTIGPNQTMKTRAQSKKEEFQKRIQALDFSSQETKPKSKNVEKEQNSKPESTEVEKEQNSNSESNKPEEDQDLIPEKHYVETYNITFVTFTFALITLGVVIGFFAAFALVEYRLN
jgi:hypothetical protein